MQPSTTTAVAVISPRCEPPTAINAESRAAFMFCVAAASNASLAARCPHEYWAVSPSLLSPLAYRSCRIVHNATAPILGCVASSVQTTSHASRTDRTTLSFFSASFSALSFFDGTKKTSKMREKYRLRAMDRADWLDPVSLSRVDRLVVALADPAELRRHRAYQTDSEAGLRDYPNLVLEMPCFAHPIIHEERPYPGVPGGGGGGTGAGGGGGGGGSGGAVMIGAAGAAQPVQAVAPMPAAAGADGTLAAAGCEAAGGMGEGGRSWGDSDLLAGGGSGAFLLVSDFEMEEDNPVEHKYRKLAHDQLRGLVDPELKPNRDERHRIDDLVAGRQDHLAMEEKDLLWKFRFCLTDNKR